MENMTIIDYHPQGQREMSKALNKTTKTILGQTIVYYSDRENMWMFFFNDKITAKQR